MCGKTGYEIDVGVPPSAPSDWESRVFHFHGFEQLPSKKQEYTVTPTFYFGGVEWYLKLYPGGQKTSQDGFIGLFLHRRARGGTIRIQWKIRIYYSDGAVVKPVMYENESEFPAKGFGYGTDNFIKRSDIISSSKPILRDGTLSICLWMRPTLGMPTTFIPPYNFANFMTPLLNSPKHADIMFVVQSAHTEEAGDEDAGTTREDEGSKEAADSFEVVQFKSANNPTKDDEGGQENQIYAHRLILQSCAPGLAMLCEPYANMTPVPIKGVNLAAFKLALKYVYGVQLQYSDWRNHSKELMDAADRFGLTHLKVEAEAWFVLSTTITSKNALELLQYADAKTFPLLKEAVMKYLLKNKIEAQKIILSSDDFPSSKTLLLDLFGAMVHDGSTYAPGPGDADFKYRAMDVDSLRRESYVIGLDCDGQREYLISNLAKVARRDMQS